MSKYKIYLEAAADVPAGWYDGRAFSCNRMIYARTEDIRVLDVRWFSGRSCIGVVRVNDPYDGIKYYIGACSGRDEQEDIESIAAWGATFPPDAGEVLFK